MPDHFPPQTWTYNQSFAGFVQHDMFTIFPIVQNNLNGTVRTKQDLPQATMRMSPAL